MRDVATKGSSRVKLIAPHLKAFTHSVGALEQLGVEARGTAVDQKVFLVPAGDSHFSRTSPWNLSSKSQEAILSYQLSIKPEDQWSCKRSPET